MPDVDTTAMAKFEFCSDAYLREARTILTRLMREYSGVLGEETYSGCVVFADPPEHLRVDGHDTVFWTMTVGANEASVIREKRLDVDSVVTSDYAQSLPRARLILTAGAPATAPEDTSVQRTGDISRVSPEMLALLRSFHNELAAITA